MTAFLALDVTTVWDYLQTNPISVSQLVLSLALVVATVVYTRYTRDQTEEMQKTRETSNQPVVQGGVGLMGPVHLVATITNTGNAPAHDVYAKLYFDDVDSDPTEFRIPILSVGEEYEFGMPLDEDGERGFVTGMDDIESRIEENDSDGVLTVETECESPFGEEYTYTREIDVLELRDNLSQLIRAGEEEKMRKALEGVESNLKKVSKQINQEYQDEKAYQELYQSVLGTVESEGVVGVDELAALIGVRSSWDIVPMLKKMKRAGWVDYPDESSLYTDDDVEVEFVGAVEDSEE